MSELRWFGKVLPKELNEIKLIIISDLHYGNPYFSYKHFQRTVDFIKNNENTYCFLNGDLCESVIKSSKGEIYKQTGSPDDQKKQIVEWLTPIKDYILGTTCLTDDTLVLTDNGWKSCYDITTSDKVYSLDIETDCGEYATLSEINIKPWDDVVYDLYSGRQFQSLTPDHRLLYWNDYKNKYEYKQVETLPEDMHHFSMPIARRFKSGVSELTDDEVRFLAWIITEGHIDYKKAKDPIVEISQSKKSNLKVLSDLFARLSLSPSLHQHKGRGERTKEQDWVCFYFPNKQVAKYIEILGGKKEISRALLNLPPSQLDILYETMMAGDGCRRSYYTASEKLARQVLELILKRGRGGRLVRRERKQLFNGYTEAVDTISYEVREYRYSNASLRKKRTRHYRGNVFCLKTANGNFMAMRNGCPFITGNTGNHENRIYESAGTDITDYIAEKLNIPYRPEGMLYKLAFGDNNNRTKGKPFVFWLYITHGYGGARTKSAKAVKAERASNWIHADLVAMSHDHVVNVSPEIYLIPDNRGTFDNNGFLSGKVTAKRKMLVKTNAFLKWGGYAETGGFPPTDLTTPVINLLTPYSKQWELYPEKPSQSIKVSV